MMTLVNISTGIYEAIVAIMLINSYTDSTKSITWYKQFISVIALAALINLSNTYLNIGIFNVVAMIFMIFVVFYIYSRQFKASALLSVILILILLVCEIVVMFSITFFANVSAEEATNAESFRILGIVLSKLFSFLLIKAICVNHRRKTIMLKGSYWALLLTIFATSTLAIFLIFIYQYNSTTETIYDKLAAWCAIGLLYNTFFSLYLYEKIVKNSEVVREHALYEQQIKSQTKHLDEIMATQKELKVLKHDMANHNIAIISLLENKENDKALEYITNLNNMPFMIEQNFDTGNTALDAILNAKRAISQSKGIKFEANIKIPEMLFVDSTDICIIFGNALDNCIEACEFVEDKYININIIYDDESLICKFENSAVKSKERFLKTIKKDSQNHGFGIMSIQSAVKKYDGVIKFNQTETQFTLSLVLFKK